MHKKKWDKITSVIIFVLSIIWFVVQKLTGIFTKIGLYEIDEIIPFIAVFSIFPIVVLHRLLKLLPPKILIQVKK
ncbi:MAG: hypothetical protein NC548_60020 [Lachnospiraceae bacterium]|nr:hypothetical protein [Lachnospiraceae bacterium]MCM1233471.1 hypothetical protein [Ruminococcus flavefaciens]